MQKVIMWMCGLLCPFLLYASPAIVIDVTAPEGDAIPTIRDAISRAAAYKGKPVVIRLGQGNYHLYRTSASEHLYHVSNTTSVDENPDPTKHIAIWLKDMKNVTIDGAGAWLITHGELTTFVVDGCENVVLKNFSLSAAAPSVPEMTVTDVGEHSLTARVTAGSDYEIKDGRFWWKGEGWRFEGGIAQVFYPSTNVTNRCESPLAGVVKAVELEDGLVRFNYGHKPDARPGDVFQMRHSYRTEVCGFIHRSKNVTLADIDFHFLGNFGIVGQYSENLTYDRICCEPALGSGRTCAGFADFVQMSGCKGKIRILNSRFEGAHDDPINIHGTHLKVTEYVGNDRIKVRFMHGQSYGFDTFFKGDEVEMVDAHSLLCLQQARVKAVERLDDYTFLLTLDRTVAGNVKASGNVVVENVTWTPEVEIRRNYFSRVPTRGILVTTRRKVLIEDNTFFRVPMSGILIADDARSWYESGPVRDVTIKGNLFVECGSPVVAISPENDRYEGAVHRNVTIERNRFVLHEGQILHARSTDGLTVRDNCIVTPQKGADAQQFIHTGNCHDVTVDGNRCVQ